MESELNKKIFENNLKKYMRESGRTRIGENCDVDAESSIYYAGIWQKIVLADNVTTETWAKSLF